MKTFGTHNYYVYIFTNPKKNVLYTGVTNSLETRAWQHKADAMGEKKTFAGKYNCYCLVYMEHYTDINVAIQREKEIKNFTRAKKEALIDSFNPGWRVLNEDW